MPGRLVLFDLDGTITRRDTYVAFLLYVLARRAGRLPWCAPLPFDVLRFKLGRLGNDELKRRFLGAILAGLGRAELATHVTGFLDRHFVRMVKPAALARIAQHRDAGDRLVLATASLDLYTTAIAERLGFDAAHSTRVGWIGERVGTALAGPNLLGEAKLAAVEAMLAGDATRPFVIAYSDHHSDLPLLLAADQGIAVDPTPRLSAAASQHGLTIEHWAGANERR